MRCSSSASRRTECSTSSSVSFRAHRCRASGLGRNQLTINGDGAARAPAQAQVVCPSLLSWASARLSESVSRPSRVTQLTRFGSGSGGTASPLLPVVSFGVVPLSGVIPHDVRGYLRSARSLGGRCRSTFFSRSLSGPGIETSCCAGAGAGSSPLSPGLGCSLGASRSAISSSHFLRSCRRQQ